MNTTRTMRNALELKFKGKRHMGQLRKRWFSQELEHIKKKGNKWQNIERKRLWRKKDGEFFIH
jgi:hypothetical protein